MVTKLEEKDKGFRSITFPALLSHPPASSLPTPHTARRQGFTPSPGRDGTDMAARETLTMWSWS